MAEKLSKKVAVPVLPTPQDSPLKDYLDSLNNILRLFFNLLTSAVNNLVEEVIVAASSISVKAYSEKSANYTVESSNDFLIHYTSGSYTVSLPTAVGITGQEFEIKNSGTGTITVDADGTETIDDSLTKTLAQYDAIKVMSSGTNWMIV